MRKTLTNVIILAYEICICLPRLRNHLTDVTLNKLMRIAIEEPEQNLVNFEEVLVKKIIEFKFKD